MIALCLQWILNTQTFGGEQDFPECGYTVIWLLGTARQNVGFETRQYATIKDGTSGSLIVTTQVSGASIIPKWRMCCDLTLDHPIPVILVVIQMTMRLPCQHSPRLRVELVQISQNICVYLCDLRLVV
jgi:hypothetical protein